MGFAVKPEAVSALGNQQERLQQDATKGKSYVADNTDLSWDGEGLINHIAGDHQAVQEQVENFLGKLADPTASDTEEALNNAAQYYRKTDDARAEALDNTYDKSEVGKAKQGGRDVDSKVGAFQDVAEPEDRYKPPKDYNSDFPYEPHWSDLASPSTLLRDAIYKVTEAATALGICDRAYDPFEVLLKPVCGDWAGMRACADVFRNVGDATTDMATNLRWSTQGLEDEWKGNAADSCEVHLLNLAKALEGAKQPLRKIAQEYENCAKGANELSSSIGVLLADVSDAALTAAASAGITALAGSTGVGLPIALVVGAFTLSRVYKVVKAVKDALDLIARIKATVDTFSSAANDFGQVDQTANLPKLPGGKPTLPS